jgi:hypothetical protein
MTSRSKPAASRKGTRKGETASAMTAREELVKALSQNLRFKLVSGSEKDSATVIAGAKPLR